jgi:molecular chaperone DnaK (HSP70)
VARSDAPVTTTLVVYDLGGGFDVSALRRRDEHGWEVAASDGCRTLTGSISMRRSCGSYLGETLRGTEQANWRRRIADGMPGRHALYQQVRAAKEQLSRDRATGRRLQLLPAHAEPAASGRACGPLTVPDRTVAILAMAGVPGD